MERLALQDLFDAYDKAVKSLDSYMVAVERQQSKQDASGNEKGTKFKTSLKSLKDRLFQHFLRETMPDWTANV